MIKKLNLVTTFAALAMFLFPWVDVQCSGKSLATQTGLQVIYGSGSPSEEMSAMAAKNGKPAETAQNASSDKSLGWAPLVGFAFLIVIAGFIASCVSIFAGGATAHRLSLILPAAALSLLLLQLAIGFPAKREMMKSLSEQTAGAASQPRDGFEEFGSNIATAIVSAIQIRTTPAFYVELFTLALPTLVLLNGVIDRYRNDSDRPRTRMNPSF